MENRVFPHCLQHRRAVQYRHYEIEQNEIRQPFVGAFQRLSAIGRRNNLVTNIDQDRFQDLRDAELVRRRPG
jgi:hypothetical protein